MTRPLHRPMGTSGADIPGPDRPKYRFGDEGEGAAAQLLAALDRVCDPCSLTAGAPLSIVEMGLVRRHHIAADGAIAVTIAVTGPGCTYVGLLVEAVEREVRTEFGAGVPVTVDVDTAHVWTEADLAPTAAATLAARRRRTVVDLGLRPRMWEDSEMEVSA